MNGILDLILNGYPTSQESSMCNGYWAITWSCSCPRSTSLDSTDHVCTKLGWQTWQTSLRSKAREQSSWLASQSKGLISPDCHASADGVCWSHYEQTGQAAARLLERPLAKHNSVRLQERRSRIVSSLICHSTLYYCGEKPSHKLIFRLKEQLIIMSTTALPPQ